MESLGERGLAQPGFAKLYFGFEIVGRDDDFFGRNNNDIAVSPNGNRVAEALVDQKRLADTFLQDEFDSLSLLRQIDVLKSWLNLHFANSTNMLHVSGLMTRGGIFSPPAETSKGVREPELS